MEIRDCNHNLCSVHIHSVFPPWPFTGSITLKVVESVLTSVLFTDLMVVRASVSYKNGESKHTVLIAHGIYQPTFDI